MVPESEEFVQKMVNGDWTSNAIIHWHVPTCDCGGPDHFREHIRMALHLSVGAGPAECLLYRFKGFERA